MTQTNMTNLRASLPDGIKKDQSKLKSVGKAYKQLRQIVVNEDGQLINQESQISQLKNFFESTNRMVEKIQSEKNKTKETIVSLQKEVEDLNTKIRQYDRSMNEDNKENRDNLEIEKLKRQYIKICQERITQANRLTVKGLKKLDLDDRKSIANEPFKWAMVAIYSQPQSKYYWPNFLQEALENDQGIDLIERLGKVSAIKAKEEQRIKTEWFLANYQKITMAPQLKKVLQEVEIFRNISKLYLQSYDIGKRISAIQTKINHEKQKMIQKDDQFLRWKARSAALQERVQLNQQFYSVLENFWNKLSEKSLKYQQKSKQLEDACDDIILADKSNFTPIINIGQKTGSGCFCL